MGPRAVLRLANVTGDRLACELKSNTFTGRCLLSSHAPVFSSVIENLGHTACAARWRGLRQVLQALAKIMLRLTGVEGWRAGLLAELVARLIDQNRHVGIRR